MHLHYNLFLVSISSVLYLYAQSSDLLVAASGWTYGHAYSLHCTCILCIFHGVLNSLEGQLCTSTHVSIQVLRITDIWCPPAFHEVTCYAVAVYICLVCTCAWQDMYVHSTLAKLECWRKKGSPNPEKQNHKHKHWNGPVLMKMYKHNMKQHIKIPPHS